MNDKSNLERVKGWIETGFKEVETSDGQVLKVALSIEEIAALRRIVENLSRFRSVKQKQDLSIGDESTKKSKVQARDEILAQEINHVDAREALSWLRTEGITSRFSGGSGDSDAFFADEAIALVEDLYRMGAVKVVAVHIQSDVEDLTQQNTDALIVELPQELERRKKIFFWKARFDRKQGWTPTKDDGQKFLKIRWD